MPSVPNPAFEVLHPRARKGVRGGEFVNVLQRLLQIGAEWDAPRGAWLVPKARRKELNALLDEVGFKVVSIPPDMRSATQQDRARLKIPKASTDAFVSVDPEAKRQAIHFDAAGRRQPVYSKAHTEAQAAAKFARTKVLVNDLPAIDEKLRAEAFSNDTAAALMLVRRLGLRIGGRGRCADARVRRLGLLRRGWTR